MGRALRLARVNEQDATPKYVQAREILIDAIRAGRLAPGAKLPSTKEISDLCDISLITAHKALEGLVESGWLRREVGRGTYVRDDVQLTGGLERRVSIGLFFDQGDHVNLDDYYHSTILEAVRKASRPDNSHVEFFFHEGYEPRRGGTDFAAICVHPRLEAQRAIERLAQRRPVIILGGALPDAPIAAVDCDNDSGARAAVRHLHGLGHRRVLVLSGPTNLSNARDRASGALSELSTLAHALDPRDQLESRDSVVLDDETRARLEQRLRAKDRPTAVLAGGFYLALAAMQVARRAELVIPADLSIVGFDDPASASLVDPPLTTVRQPLAQMAARAYERVRAALLGAPIGTACELLPTELVMRSSTGPYTPVTRLAVHSGGVALGDHANRI